MIKIAVDGPAGAGKSTIAKIVAKELNIEYIDTGAMYRAITLKAMKLNKNLEDENAYDFLESTKLDSVNGKIYLDDIDVNEEIRSVDVTKNVSTPSKMAIVRNYLVNFQREISKSKSVIMDGRDIGTVVLPDANPKIYLDASVECRAIRRMNERSAKGIQTSFEETKEEIIVRDKKDSSREISPLRVADDAIVIDTSDMSIEQVVTKIIEIVNERGLMKMSNELFKEGQEVKGIIKNVTKTAVYIDLAGDTTGVIYTNDLENYTEGQKLSQMYHEGEEFTALVKQVTKDKKRETPLIVLSTKLYQAKEKLPLFDELKEKDEIIEAKVVATNKGGAELSYDDFKLFLPQRLSSLSPEALNQLKGEKIKVIVTSVDHDTLRVVVSQILAEKKEHRLAKEEALSQIHVDDILTGTVEKVVDFGAFVSFGLVSGLLHRNEIAHKASRNVTPIKEGDEVKVKVLSVENGKISLSMKALTPHPWTVLKDKYHVDDVFDGEIVNIIPAGLIIKLTDDYNGLMPGAEYSWFVNDKMDGKVEIGQTIKVKVTAIDDEKQRVSLSHKQTLDNTWGSVKLRRGDTINVTIISSEEKGAKVAFGNIEGFLPLNEVSQTKRVSKIEEAYPLNTKVDALVQDFDASRARLVVSIKQLEIAKERASYDNYLKKEASEKRETTIGDLLGDKINDFFKEN